MSNRKTFVKVYYLMSAIPVFNDPEEVLSDMRASIAKRLIGEGEVAVELRPCVKLPGGLEIKVAIYSKATPSINALRAIDRDFVRIVAHDQNVGHTFRISTGIDNSDPETEAPAPEAVQTERPAEGTEKELPNSMPEEEDVAARARNFLAVEPEYTFDRVILPQKKKDEIRRAVKILELRKKVFEEWGLYALDKHPSSALNFYGPPGTGKSMSADAVANMLGKKILKVSYADIGSKYVGEGPKTVRAVFYAAQESDSVLFFDEADSLLSKRISDISHNGDLEVNGTRSEILMQIEKFEGVVIFATNLVNVYDPAVLSRLQCISFEKPDAEARAAIWEVHLRSKDDSLRIPLADDVDTKALGEAYELSGREIKRAVISTCLSVAERGEDVVRQADFVAVCDGIKAEKDALNAEQELLKRVAKKAIEEAGKKEPAPSEPKTDPSDQ